MLGDQGIKPGRFFTHDLGKVHWEMLNQGLVPTVLMKIVWSRAA